MTIAPESNSNTSTDTCGNHDRALLDGMIVQVIASDPPIEIESVVEIDRRGERCWLIKGKPQTVRLGCAGRTQEVTTYTVPVGYRGLRYVG